MKENKKMLIVLIIFLVFIVGLVFIVMSKGGKDEDVLNEFYEALNSRKYEIIYLGQTNCGYCQTLDEDLKTIKEVQKFDHLKINLDKLLSSAVDEIFDRLSIDPSGEISTPYVVIVKEGEIVDQFNSVGINELVEILKDYNFLDKDFSLGINYLDFDEYLNLYDSGSKMVVAFSSVTEAGSETRTLKSVLREITLEKNVEINYFDLLFDTETEYNIFADTFELVKTEDIPIIAIIQNQKVVDYVSATTSKSEILAMLKENKIVK